MITRIILVCIISLSFMVGCGADHGRVKVDDRGFEVEAGKDGHHHDGDRHHNYDKNKRGSKCPPGHRMKGWCK